MLEEAVFEEEVIFFQNTLMAIWFLSLDEGVEYYVDIPAT